MLLQGPKGLHFAPVEENQIPRFYQLLEERGINDDPYREIVAVYPTDGTMWQYHPFSVVNAPWVEERQRQAARMVEEYLRSVEVQNQFMEAGFRPGIYLSPEDTLTPSRGLNLKQPRVFFGPLKDSEPAEAREIWQQVIPYQLDLGLTRDAKPGARTTSYWSK